MDTKAVGVARLQPRLWDSLREAIRGSHQDFTAGNVNCAILLLAVPIMLEMILESLFAVVDVFWVAHLGANAVAAVGRTESMFSLVLAVGIGLSMSTTAMVARHIGERDPEAAAVAAVQAVLLGLLTSLAIGVPCLLYASRLLRLMGGSPAIVAVGSGYARILLGRQRHRSVALLEQCDLPRCRRRSDRNAAVVGIEHHQSGNLIPA